MVKYEKVSNRLSQMQREKGQDDGDGPESMDVPLVLTRRESPSTMASLQQVRTRITWINYFSDP